MGFQFVQYHISIWCLSNGINLKEMTLKMTWQKSQKNVFTRYSPKCLAAQNIFSLNHINPPNWTINLQKKYKYEQMYGKLKINCMLYSTTIMFKFGEGNLLDALYVVCMYVCNVYLYTAHITFVSWRFTNSYWKEIKSTLNH